MAEATPPSMDRIFINLGDSSMSMFLINYLEKRQRLEEEHCPVEAELGREWNHRPGKCTLNPPPNLPTCHIYRPYHHLLGSSKLSRRQICLKKCTNKSKQPQNAGVAENGKICGKMLYWQSRPRDADDTADPLNNDAIPQTLHVAQDTIFRVYCTVINKDMTMLSRKRQLNILDKVDKSTFLSVLWSCATIVFDISTYPDQLEQIDFVIRSLMEELTKLEGERKLGQIGIRRIILVSPSMTWALTQTIDMDDTDSALIEEYYNKRKPDPEYIFHYQIENRLLALANRFKGQIKVLIISSGCVYGHGEHLLDTLFGEIWSSSLKEIPICGTGENRIPVIYDADLARIIFHFVINFPQGIKYIFAMEKESPTQLELVKAIMSNLSKRRVKIYSSHASMFSKLKPELNRVLESNLNLRPHFLTKVLDWDTSMRITRDLPSIVEEFKKRCNLKPLRIILLGPDTFGKRLIAKNLCKYYNITYISPASLALQYIRQLKFIIGKKKLESRIQHKKNEKVKAAHSKAKVVGQSQLREEGRNRWNKGVRNQPSAEVANSDFPQGYPFITTPVPFQMKTIVPSPQIKQKISMEISKIKAKYKRKITHRIWKENIVIRYKKPTSLAMKKRRRLHKMKKLATWSQDLGSMVRWQHLRKLEKLRVVRVKLKGTGKLGPRLTVLSTLYRKKYIKRGLYRKFMDKINNRGILNMQGKLKQLIKMFSNNWKSEGRLLSYSVLREKNISREIITRLKNKNHGDVSGGSAFSKGSKNKEQIKKKGGRINEASMEQRELRKKECKRLKKKMVKKERAESQLGSSGSVSTKKKESRNKITTGTEDRKKGSVKKKDLVARDLPKIQKSEEIMQKRKRKEFGFRISWRQAEGKLGAVLKRNWKEKVVLTKEANNKEKEETYFETERITLNNEKMNAMKPRGHVLRKMTLTEIAGRQEDCKLIRKYKIETPKQIEAGIRRAMKRKLKDTAIKKLKTNFIKARNSDSINANIKDRRRKQNLKQELSVSNQTQYVKGGLEYCKKQKFKQVIISKRDNNDEDTEQNDRKFAMIENIEGENVMARHRQQISWKEMVLGREMGKLELLSGAEQRSTCCELICRMREREKKGLRKKCKAQMTELCKRGKDAKETTESGNCQKYKDSEVKEIPVKLGESTLKSNITVEAKLWIRDQPSPVTVIISQPRRTKYEPEENLSYHQEEKVTTPSIHGSLSLRNAQVDKLSEENKAMCMKVNLLEEYESCPLDNSLIKSAVDKAITVIVSGEDTHSNIYEADQTTTKQRKTMRMRKKEHLVTQQHRLNQQNNKFKSILNLLKWDLRTIKTIFPPENVTMVNQCCHRLPPQEWVINGKYTVNDIINLKPIRNILDKLKYSSFETPKETARNIRLIKTRSITVKVTLKDQLISDRETVTVPEDHWREKDKSYLYLCDRIEPLEEQGFEEGTDCSRRQPGRKEICCINVLRDGVTSSDNALARYMTQIKVKGSQQQLESDKLSAKLSSQKPNNIWVVNSKPMTKREWTLATGLVERNPRMVEGGWERKRGRYCLVKGGNCKKSSRGHLRRRRRHEVKRRKQCRRQKQSRRLKEGSSEERYRIQVYTRRRHRRARRDARRQAAVWRQRLETLSREQLLRRARLRLRRARTYHNPASILLIRRALRRMVIRMNKVMSVVDKEVRRAQHHLSNRRRLWQLRNSGDLRAALVQKRIHLAQLGNAAPAHNHCIHRTFRRHRPHYHRHRPTRHPRTSCHITPSFVRNMRALRAQLIQWRHPKGVAHRVLSDSELKMGMLHLQGHRLGRHHVHGVIRSDADHLEMLRGYPPHSFQHEKQTHQQFDYHDLITSAQKPTHSVSTPQIASAVGMAKYIKKLVVGNVSKIKSLQDKSLYIKRVSRLLCNNKEFWEMKRVLFEKGEDPELHQDWKYAEQEAEYGHPISYYKQLLKNLKQQAKNFGHFNEVATLKLVRKKIKSKTCQIHGYLLDTYPLTYAQANGLTRLSSKVKEETNLIKLEGQSVDKRMVPDYIIKIDAPDKYMMFHDKYFGHSKMFSSKEIHRAMLKLHNYRLITRKLPTAEDYFDELRIPCHLFNIQDEHSPVFADTILSIFRIIGKPNLKDENITGWLKGLKKRYNSRLSKQSMTKGTKTVHTEKSTLQPKDIPSEEEFPKSRSRLVKEKVYKKSLLEIHGYTSRTILHILTNCLCSLLAVKPPDPIDYMVKYIIKRNVCGRKRRSSRKEEKRVMGAKVVASQMTSKCLPCQASPPHKYRPQCSLPSMHTITNRVCIKEPDQVSIVPHTSDIDLQFE